MDLITELEVLDTGKAIWEVRADINACVDTMNYYAAIAQSIKGFTYISIIIIIIVTIVVVIIVIIFNVFCFIFI